MESYFLIVEHSYLLVSYSAEKLAKFRGPKSLATGRNNGLLDERCQHWTLTCCELQLTKQPDSREDIDKVSPAQDVDCVT